MSKTFGKSQRSISLLENKIYRHFDSLEAFSVHSHLSVGMIRGIITGDVAITPEIAQILEETLYWPKDLWLTIQDSKTISLKPCNQNK